MVGLGTIINVAAIVAGGVVGMLAGRALTPRIQESLIAASGVAVLFIGIGGACAGMLQVVDGGTLGTTNTMMFIISIIGGALVGELCHLQDGIERFGEWLKHKSGNSGDAGFTNAFVTASLTVCVGAMAIVGSIQDGIAGDYSILAAKAVLDLIIIAAMTASMGKGCAFSAIPVGILQGSVTLLAALLAPYMSDAGMLNISLVGSIMIFCVGLNLLREKQIRVANMLPGLIIAFVWALF